MSRLHPVRGEDVVKALESIGFFVERQRGSHVFMKHSDGRSTVVPVHKGEDLGPGILLKIMHDVNMTRKEFLEMLRR